MSLDVGNALSALRHEKNISQHAAADELGVSQALLSHYENGLREPRLEFIVRACEYYGVSADYLFGRTETRLNPLTDSRCDGKRLAELSGKVCAVFSELDDASAESAEKIILSSLCRILLAAGCSLPDISDLPSRALCSAYGDISEAELFDASAARKAPENGTAAALLSDMAKRLKVLHL